MFELKLENESGNIVDLNDGVDYVVIDISGLNPPSASLYTSKSPNRKGVKYNGSTLNERSIIITIKPLGDVEINRNILYDWIDPEQYVKIHYRNGIKNVYCEGHVSECDFNPFTDNELINVAITCEDPYWKELNDIAVEVSNILKQFTFPFAITNPIPFSTFKDTNTTIINNDGNETGIKMRIKCFGDIENLTIYDASDTTKEFKLNTTLKKGWVVEIDTDSSPKTVKAHKEDGSVENLLKYTAGTVTWFTLKKGRNAFGYKADSGGTNLEMNIVYTTKHLGV